MSLNKAIETPAKPLPAGRQRRSTAGPGRSSRRPGSQAIRQPCHRRRPKRMRPSRRTNRRQFRQLPIQPASRITAGSESGVDRAKSSLGPLPSDRQRRTGSNRGGSMRARPYSLLDEIDPASPSSFSAGSASRNLCHASSHIRVDAGRSHAVLSAALQTRIQKEWIDKSSRATAGHEVLIDLPDGACSTIPASDPGPRTLLATLSPDRPEPSSELRMGVLSRVNGVCRSGRPIWDPGSARSHARSDEVPSWRRLKASRPAVWSTRGKIGVEALRPTNWRREMQA